MKITKEILQQKYQAFLEDKTQLERLNKQGFKLGQPGFMVELFVFDISKEVDFEMDDYYVRYTGIAKILQASPANKEIGGGVEKFKAGDIVSVGDTMGVMTLNQEWELWFDAQRSPNNEPAENEPIKYLRRVHQWISHGKLWYMDRAEYLVKGQNLTWDEKAINNFRGPYVFQVDIQEVLGPITNPFEA